MVRAGTDRRRETSLVVTGGVVLAGIMPLFLPVPPVATWRLSADPCGLECGVFCADRGGSPARGGIALAYPLMCAASLPMLAALAAWGLIGEALSVGAWIGASRRSCLGCMLARPAVCWGNGWSCDWRWRTPVVIAAYTLNDAVCVGLSGAPFASRCGCFR